MSPRFFPSFHEPGYTFQPLADVVLADGVGQTHVFGSAERRAVHDGDERLFEQQVAEIRGVVYDPAVARLSERAGHVHHDVERALRLVARSVRHLVYKPDDELSAAVERRLHRAQEFVAAAVGQRDERSVLRYGVGVGSRVALYGAHCLRHADGSGGEAHAPAGHRIGLAQTRADDRALLHLFRARRKRVFRIFRR